MVDILHDGFDYRGRQPVKALLVYAARAMPDLIYGGFTPEDLVTSDVVVPAAHASAARKVAAAVAGDADRTVVKLGTTLLFDGGVTAEWVLRRLQEWDQTAWTARKEAAKKH